VGNRFDGGLSFVGQAENRLRRPETGERELAEWH
jgi:hypothetical protein